MNQVQLDWQVACQENTTKSYYRFLKNHPDTPYTEEAKTCIEEAKEKRVFEECVKECSMRRYLKRYPQGKLLQEALEYKEKFKKENIIRMLCTSILSITILGVLIVVLRDEYHTYNDLSSCLIKLLMAESVVVICFDMRRWAFVQLIFIPLILTFTLATFSPEIEFVSNNHRGDVRQALFYYIKDTSTNRKHVSGYNILNKTENTLYITRLEYKENSKKIIGVKRILSGEICKTSPIELYFENPPIQLNMNEIVTRTRRGHTRYVTVHHEKRYIDVLDYKPY